LFKLLAGFSTLPGLSKTVYMSALYAQSKGLSSKSVTYESFPFTETSGYSHRSWSQTGPAIFTFVIAAHTFSLLFLRRPWSDRTCNIVLVVAWALLPLEICIDNYIRAGPKVKGPLYGISSYWCWISPIYLTERYTTDYLFMMVTAVLCFILYSLVFFGLRGNISVSGGYKIHFHRRPERRMSRAIDGKPVESDVTRVARHMLWYPLVYTILVLPVATARLSTFSSVSVPFPVTIFTVALFMLHGFLNTLLFCTTRRIIPGTWGQKFGLGPVLGGGRGGCDPARPAYVTWPFAIIGSIPTTLSVGVEKDVEINSEAEPSAPYVEFGSPTSPISPASATSSASPTSPTSPASPTPLLQAHVSSRHRADPH